MPNSLYYGTITNFYVDGLPLPMPRSMKPSLIYTEIKKRSLNNTLTIDRFEFEDKHEFVFDWSLTTEEFEQFKTFLNRDFVPVIIDMTDHSFTLDLRFSYTDYEITGSRINISVTAQEK